MQFTPPQINQALTLPDFDVLAARQPMSMLNRALSRPINLAGEPRRSAVLILLYNVAGETMVVLTKRLETLSNHGGQISFPGGSQDEGESLRETALRETREEIGVENAGISILGNLSNIYIPPTDFLVKPFVGWHKQRPRFIRNETEVQTIIETPLRHLLNPASRRKELWNLRGHEIMIPFFQVNEHKVWGATAIILSEFLVRLQTSPF